MRAPLRERLEAWGDAELAVMRTVKVDAKLMQYSRGELIAHLLLHERAHHGDVTTLLWQLGIDPDLGIEYRFSLGDREAPDPGLPSQRD